MSSLSKRVTVGYYSHRGPAVLAFEREREQFPDANVSISGEPGHWKVRRDRQPTDPERVWPIRGLRFV